MVRKAVMWTVLPRSPNTDREGSRPILVAYLVSSVLMAPDVHKRPEGSGWGSPDKTSGVDRPSLLSLRRGSVRA